MQHVTEMFIKPMRFRCRVPAGLDPSAFEADVAESLSGYTVHQLQNAALWFRDNRKSRDFPSIAECRETCEKFPLDPQEAAAQAAKPRRWKTDEERRSEAIAADIRRKAAVERLTGCDLANRALSEGWLLTLLEFVEDWQRLPEWREVETCRSKSEGLDAAARGVVGSIGASVRDVRAIMKTRAIRAVFGADLAAQWEGAVRAELSPTALVAAE